jgi:hypothetical protein
MVSGSGFGDRSIQATKKLHICSLLPEKLALVHILISHSVVEQFDTLPLIKGGHHNTPHLQ